MNPVALPESVFQALGWAMLHFLWIGAGVGLLCAILERFLLRGVAPAFRYAFGLASLGLLAGIAGLCVWKMWPEGGHPVMAKAVPVVAPVWDEIGSDLTFPVNRDLDAEVRTGLLGATSQGAANPTGSNFDWIAVLPWVWLAGSTTLAAMLGFGFLGTVRLRRGASTTGLRRARVRCAKLCERLGIRVRVGLAASERVVSPIVVGIFRPLIVLPASAVSGMPREMLEWILLHELAHVRRLDNAAILLQRVLECLLFFHPCVWLVSRWVDREREFCCDHFALAHNADRDPAGYAEVLARLAGVALPPLAPASAMASHAVVHRIRGVLNTRKSPVRAGGGSAVFGVLLIGLVSAATMLWAFSEPEPASETGAETPVEEPAQTGDPEVPTKTFQGPGVLGELDRLWETKDGLPADLRPVEVVEKPASPAGIGAATEMVTKVYPVPPDFMHYFGGRDNTLQEYLEANGFDFPDEAFATFEPSCSWVVVRHFGETLEKIVAELDGRYPDRVRQAQVLLTADLKWKQGATERETAAPSVVTRDGQRAKIEKIREMVVSRDQAVKLGQIEPEVDSGESFVIPLGLQWETDPTLRDGLLLDLKGEFVLTIPKGADPIGYAEDLDAGGSSDKPDPKKITALDVYRAPFVVTVGSGESVDVPFLANEDLRAQGTLSATLTATLIDPSGQPITTQEGFEKACPLFTMRARSRTVGEAGRGERLTTLALAAFDLGDYQNAGHWARMAFTLDPEAGERYPFWNQTREALSNPPERAAGDADGWMERSYRLRAPLLPADCVADGDALRAFLIEQGMAFPVGATAVLAEDGVTVVVRNRNDEMERLEAGLTRRVLGYAEGAVSVSVEVLSGSVEAIKAVVGPGYVDDLGISAFYSDEEYTKLMKGGSPEGTRRESYSSRLLERGGEIDVLEPLPLEGASALLRTVVGGDGETIEANFTMVPSDRRNQKDAAIIPRRSSTTLTVWDKGWIALGAPAKDGTAHLVFVRLEIVRV